MTRNWRELISNDAKSKIVPIKTHDPPDDNAPAIFIIRDGRAAIHSCYGYHKNYAFEQPSLTETIAGACQFGSWSEHYLAWRPQTRAHTLLLRYEELVTKPEAVIPRLADFLHIEPSGGRLPPFEELQARLPGFFRRGNNKDCLTLWAPEQMTLFNQLHGPVMEELGYPLVTTANSGIKAAVELAHSAARLHALYEEKLTKLGYAVISQQQLSQEVARLSRELSLLSQQLGHKEKLLTNRWVKFGIALGAVPGARRKNGN